MKCGLCSTEMRLMFNEFRWIYYWWCPKCHASAKDVDE